MKIKITSFTDMLNKISYTQAGITCLISLIYLIYKEFSILTGILISGLTSFTYTQLIKASSYSKIFVLLGFPIRLVIVALPCAILVHKLHSNLIALFIGFAICQTIYLIFVWFYANMQIKE
ncbi:MAG: hypothetical protein HY094_03500 [Candidatus Melainabacteria bacterium]|nr:hypothetical protein [Candidatus Melainabacteria bacterium]